MNLLNPGILEKAKDIVELPTQDGYDVAFEAELMYDGSPNPTLVPFTVTYRRLLIEFTVCMEVQVDGRVRHLMEIKNKQAYGRAKEFWLQILLKKVSLDDAEVQEEYERVDNLVDNI